MVEIDLEDPYTKEQFDKYMLELEENAKKWWMVPSRDYNIDVRPNRFVLMTRRYT